MINDKSVGLKTAQRFTYTRRDVILYNLAVGAGQENLEYVYEKVLKPLPTFAVIPCTGTFGCEPFYEAPLSPENLIPGVHREGTLHMSQRLVLHKPLAPEAVLDIEKVITHIYDRGEGKGAVVETDVTGRDQNGEPVFTNTMQVLKGLDGGFGGQPMPKSGTAIPARDPDYTERCCYPENAALLYRLTGDTFGIHVDPEFAGVCGFSRPIAHGLCGLGHITLCMVNHFFPGEPERLKDIEVQFRAVAYPGESFLMQVWQEATGTALFRMVRESDGKAILDKGVMHWA